MSDENEPVRPVANPDVPLAPLETTWDLVGNARPDTKIQIPAKASSHSRTSVSTDGPMLDVPGYEVIAEIGRGGMGVVYRARDLAIDREIALKVLQDKYTLDSPSAARFVEEARITGQLQHPGIPAVHQIGKLSDGRPFLAMKLIRGRTLDQLFEVRSADREKNWLGVFEAICQAVGYAHAHQVIHRDLKPANIMVGSFGEVQVMDWGLAKVLTSDRTIEEAKLPPESSVVTEIRSLRESDGILTQHGSVFGTPAYMSPEQAGGEIDRIDQRSDVFSLGSILCFMLTGKPPYIGKGSEAIRLAALRGKLDEAYDRLDVSGAEPGLIALGKKCLRFEPGDRPADANAVAMAVASLRTAAEERARLAEIDRARAQVQADEQRKRRRMQLALATSVLVVLTLIGGGLLWADRQAAEQARADADRDSERKLAEAEKARLAAEREAERRIGAERNRQEVETALDQAHTALGRDNPVYSEIDAALLLAEKRLAFGGNDQARMRFQRLQNDRRILSRLDQIDDRRWLLVLNAQELDTEYAASNYPIAFREYGLDVDKMSIVELAEKVQRSAISVHLRTALDAWWSLYCEPKVLQLIDALDADPVHRALRAAIARSDQTAVAEQTARLNGGSMTPAIAQMIGQHRLTPQDRAVRILTEAQATHPNHFGLAFITAQRFAKDQFDHKIAYFRIALAIRPTSAMCYGSLSLEHHAKMELDDAVAASREAIRYNPTSPVLHNNLGRILHDKKDYDGAVAEYKEAIRCNPWLAMPHSNLANALRLKKDFAGAIAACREAIRLDPQLAGPFINLGNILRDQRNFDGAIAQYQIAIQRDPKSALAHTNLGCTLEDKNDLSGALLACREAIRLNPRLALAHSNLGKILMATGDPDAAIAAFKEAIRLDPKYPVPHNNLGAALVLRKDWDGALAAYHEAIKLDPSWAVPHGAIGDVLRQKDNLDGAWRAYQEALRLDSKWAGPHYGMGIILLNKKDDNEALKQFRTYIVLDPNFYAPYLLSADIFSRRNEPMAGLRILQEGIAANPDWINDVQKQLRYNCACFAVLAGTGKGKDALSAANRGGLRNEAWAWLNADLAGLRKLLVNPANRPLANARMAHWLADADLAFVRDEDKIKALATEEQARWAQLWIDVRKLRDETMPAELLPPPRQVER